MVFESLLRSGTSPTSQPLAQFLPVALAWAVIAVCCFYGLVPLSNTRSQQTTFLDRKNQLPRWFQNRYFDAALIFLFHALVVADSHVNTWTLPLLAIVICFTAQSTGNLDTKLANLSQLISHWRLSLKYNDIDSLKPVAWLAACLLTIVTALLSEGTSTQFAFGVFVFLIGYSVYTYVPESISRSDHTTSQELQKSILLPIALQSFGCALIIWVIFGGYILALGSIALFTISTTVKGLAILLSITEGTALPVLAALSIGAIVQTIFVSSPGSLLVSGILLVALVAQLMLSLPNAAEKQRVFWTYTVAPIFAVTVLQILAGTSSSSLGSSYQPHPIQVLHETAIVDFQRKLAKQSKTTAQATEEYIRRYKRKPPPRFEAWFEVAKANKFQLVDEFDTIMSSIIPFWGLEAKHLKNRMDTAGDGYGITTIYFRNNENITYDPEHYHVPIIIDWLAPYMQYNLLPDFDFLINVLDEPRVNAPFEVAKAASDHSYTTSKSSYGSVPITWVEVSRQNLKDDITPACPPSIDLRTVENLPLPFITNITTAKDYCHNPSFFENHGFFQAPETLVITHNLLPVLSQCKPGRFNDILYPSPYYTTLDQFQGLDDADDPEWDDKLDDLYWSGSSTGGRSTLENWKTLHRQRLALLSTTDSSTPLQLLKPSSTTSFGWAVYQSTWDAVKAILSIRLNRVVQCDPGACEAMEEAFPLVGTQDPVATSVESKYSLDMDGNTFTGRFYRLLKSRSCILKMSAFKEWHDDHLAPWVHYIPVTSSFDELGEIMRYLIADENGQKIGKTIAAESRSWANKVLRKTDLEIVMLRVLMEVARMIETND